MILDLSEKHQGSWVGRFLAVLYYELLWNLRKKKMVGVLFLAFLIVTLIAVVPWLLAEYTDFPFEEDPLFVINNVSTMSGGFVMFLFAVAITMNMISGEFESQTIIPLLTKPISRGLIFSAKIAAALITIVGAYLFLTGYITIAGYLIYGPQEALHLLPLGILGAIGGTLVWVSIVVAFSSVFKSSNIAVMGSLGTFLGIVMVGTIVASFGQPMILLYTPGDGAIGVSGGCDSLIGFAGGMNTGTNALGRLLVEWVQNPDLTIDICGVSFGNGPGEGPSSIQLLSDPISILVIRTLSVAMIYMITFFAIGWLAFRRAQIAD